jgi:hypothetical protein
MSDMTLEVTKCPHGVWHSHNALQLEDGTTIDDPEGSCPGGVVEVDGRRFGISMALAFSLKRFEEERTRIEVDYS